MQHARALHRAMNVMRTVGRLSVAAFEPIVGRYLNLEVDGRGYRIFVEEAGRAFRCCACTRPAPTAASSGTC